MAGFIGPKRLDGDSTTARVFLAFLATAGLFYVNIMPALVNGLIVALDMSNREAGFIASANVYGAACGAFVAILLVKHLPWRKTCFVLLSGLIVADVASCFVVQFWPLLLLRAGHGLMGGLSVGIGLAIMARTHNPDRSFGYLLLVQYGLGGLCVMVIPPLVPEWGMPLVFGTLIAFTSITLLMLPFLPDYAPTTQAALSRSSLRSSWQQALPLWAGIFLFQGANMALNAYIIGIGEHNRLALGFISTVLGWASWIALLGCLFVILLSQRFRRGPLLACGLVVAIFANAAFLFSDWAMVYISANVVSAVCWSFCVPYFFGYSAQIDPSGQLATATGLASKLGLASGPLMAALIVGEQNYDQLIVIASVALLAGLVVMTPLLRARTL